MTSKLNQDQLRKKLEELTSRHDEVHIQLSHVAVDHGTESGEYRKLLSEWVELRQNISQIENRIYENT